MTQDLSLPVALPTPTRSRRLLVIAILTMLAPLIAVLPVCIFLLIVKLPNSSWSDVGELMLAAVFVAYAVGWLYALLTGAIVAAWSLWRRPGLIAVIIAAVIANAILYFVDPVSERFFPYPPDMKLVAAQSLLYLSVFAASICWLIGRKAVRAT